MTRDESMKFAPKRMKKLGLDELRDLGIRHGNDKTEKCKEKKGN